MKNIPLIALLLVSFALADGVPEDRSFYWGARLSLLVGGVWDDESVKGVFNTTRSVVEESSLLKNNDMGLEFGALCWYRLNRVAGFEGEANLRFTGFTLENRIYNRPLDSSLDGMYDASLLVVSFDVPVVLRVTPSPNYYLESGAQFNLNIGGEIANSEESFDFDCEGMGWALVFGAGAFSSNPSKNLLWSAGIRLVVDMARIEKEGIVEIRKGATYREASPLKLWNFQFNLAFYF